MASTRAAPCRATSTDVSTPGPHPTSRTRPSAGTSMVSAKSGASGSENRPMNRAYESALPKAMRGI